MIKMVKSNKKAERKSSIEIQPGIRDCPKKLIGKILTFRENN